MRERHREHSETVSKKVNTKSIHSAESHWGQKQSDHDTLSPGCAVFSTKSSRSSVVTMLAYRSEGLVTRRLAEWCKWPAWVSRTLLPWVSYVLHKSRYYIMDYIFTKSSAHCVLCESSVRFYTSYHTVHHKGEYHAEDSNALLFSLFEWSQDKDSVKMIQTRIVMKIKSKAFIILWLQSVRCCCRLISENALWGNLNGL